MVTLILSQGCFSPKVVITWCWPSYIEMVLLWVIGYIPVWMCLTLTSLVYRWTGCSVTKGQSAPSSSPSKHTRLCLKGEPSSYNCLTTVEMESTLYSTNKCWPPLESLVFQESVESVEEWCSIQPMAMLLTVSTFMWLGFNNWLPAPLWSC